MTRVCSPEPTVVSSESTQQLHYRQPTLRIVSMNRKQRRAAKQQPQTAGPLRPQFLAEAQNHHQAGRFDQARDLYLKALTLDPDNADALHFLGILRYQQGDPAQAVELISKALATKSDYPEAYSNLGIALAALGKTDVRACRHSMCS